MPTLDELQPGGYYVDPEAQQPYMQLRPIRRGQEGALTRGTEIAGQAATNALTAVPRAAAGMVGAAAYDAANPGEFTLGDAGARFGAEAIQTMAGGVPRRGGAAVLRAGPSLIGGSGYGRELPRAAEKGLTAGQADLFKSYSKIPDTYKGYTNDDFATLTQAQKIEEYNVASAMHQADTKKMTDKLLAGKADDPNLNAAAREKAAEAAAKAHATETDLLPPLSPDAREQLAQQGGYTTKAYRGVSGTSERRVHPKGYEYFSTSDPGLAGRYAGVDDKTQLADLAFYTNEGKGPRTQPLRLNTKDYLDFDAKGKQWGTAQLMAFPKAERQGKKGIIMRNVYDEPSGSGEGPAPTTVYVTFDPTTRKSQFAKRFDPTSPDIMRAQVVGGGPVPGTSTEVLEPSTKKKDKEK